MGIKNLNTLLNKFCPGIFIESNVSKFKYKKIAIDTSLYVCKFKVIYGEEWFKHMFYLIAKLRENDIHTVFIFDTKAPPEKNLEREERQKKQDYIKNKIINLEQALNHYFDTNEIQDVLKKYQTTQIITGKLNFNVEKAQSDLEKIKRQVITKTKEDFELTKELLKILKVPYYDAPMEAECAASDLCKRGMVDAVLSEDTDCLTYGAPTLISKFKPLNGQYIEISYDLLLEKLELNSNEFIDLCIMCGCDYNKNIPKIGPMTSYELIRKYRSIDEIKLKTKLNTDILNHERSRELFKKYEQMNIESIPYCGMPNQDEVVDFLHKHGIKITRDVVEKSFIHNTIVFE